MFIKLNKSCNSEIIRSILDSMDLSHSANINLISDVPLKVFIHRSVKGRRRINKVLYMDQQFV
jgi:hypothetical protein